MKRRKPVITTAHKLAVAKVLANSVENIGVHNIIPSPLDRSLVDKIIEAMKNI